MSAPIPIVVTEKVGVAFARLGSGALAVGHRPPLRSFDRMRANGVTHIATVLSEAEDPHAIEAAARSAGLSWLWLPLGSTKTLPARAKPEVVRLLQTMTEVLDREGCIYLHCAAGIHRTGMIAAALLFHLGYDEGQTVAALTALRPVTAEGMGAARLEWARSFARREI